MSSHVKTSLTRAFHPLARTSGSPCMILTSVRICSGSLSVGSGPSTSKENVVLCRLPMRHGPISKAEPSMMHAGCPRSGGIVLTLRHSTIGVPISSLTGWSPSKSERRMSRVPRLTSLMFAMRGLLRIWPSRRTSMPVGISGVALRSGVTTGMEYMSRRFVLATRSVTQTVATTPSSPMTGPATVQAIADAQNGSAASSTRYIKHPCGPVRTAVPLTGMRNAYAESYTTLTAKLGNCIRRAKFDWFGGCLGGPDAIRRATREACVTCGDCMSRPLDA
jgi:hypothetical protein